MQNLFIIGSSHIARQSVAEVKQAVESIKPDIIALELDKERFMALLYENKKNKKELPERASRSIQRVGLKGYLFAKIGEFVQKKLGDYVGVAPGSEMKTAIALAKKNNIEIALIDQEIEVTLRRFSQGLSWKERWNFVVDIVTAPFSKKKVSFDLQSVPEKELIRMMIGEVKKRYPNVYRVLIKERNEYMAKKLARLLQSNPQKKILAVVGAGHEEELEHLVKKHLQSSVSYSYNVEYQ
jgi:pheromone shutdown-related protein TraB